MNAMITHLSSGATTVCRAWSLTRKDGLRLGFTDHDLALEFDGLEFRADTGMTARALESGTGLAVDNSEALGVLSDPDMTEADIEAGLFDGAQVTCWLVNWQDTSERTVLFCGSIGDITHSGQHFTAELRGMSEGLNVPNGRLYHSECPARLGDQECGVDTSQAQFRAECIVEALNSGGALRLSGLEGFDEGWFTHGRIELASSASKRAIKIDSGLGDLRLISPWDVSGIEVGDRVVLIAGCDRRAATCRSKFSNFVNFRGFPDIPGDDWLMQSPLSDTNAQGGSRR